MKLRLDPPHLPLLPPGSDTLRAVKFLLLLPLLIALPSGSSPPEVLPSVQEKGCRRCDQRGVVDCKSHDAELRALEQEVWCTVAAACDACGGALVVACEHCDGGPETAAMFTRRKALQDWAADPHPVEELLHQKVMRIESTHLELVGAIGKLKRGRKKIDGHHFLHHLARDGERAAKQIDEHFEVDPKEAYKTLMRLWFWQEPGVHAEVMDKVLLSASTGDYKLLGKDPIFSVCTSDAIFKNDYDALLTLGVHNAAHMLLSNMTLELWIGLEGAGWFDVGAAHWYEEQIFGQHRHYCVDEAHDPWKWDARYWRSTTRKLLESEEKRFLPLILNQQTGEMPDWAHGLSWSFYDWLVAKQPKCLYPMLMGLKKKTPTRKLTSELLGLNLFEAEAAWRLWVTETYPLREKKKKKKRGR